MEEVLCNHGRPLAWTGPGDACPACLEAGKVKHKADPVTVRNSEGEFPTCRKCGGHAGDRLMHIVK